MRASAEVNKGEHPKDECGIQTSWGRTILSEATSKGPVLFSGTDWVIVPMESLSPARRAIIHPISQRLAGVENNALVDGLFGRIWEFPKCENVRERKVTRGDQFVGDSRIDFQWNKTERTLCRVCGKHILKQKFATEHYQRSPTCWRLVMRHIGILDLDSNSNQNMNSSHTPYKAEDGGYNSSQNPMIESRIPPNYCRNDGTYLSNGQIEGQAPLLTESLAQSSYSAYSMIPTSNVEYILQSKIMNLFRAATKQVYEELIQFKCTNNPMSIHPSFGTSSSGNGPKYDSSIVENVMNEPCVDDSQNSLGTPEEPFLLISAVLPNIFPSISHRPLPVNVCYIKLTFNWPGARLVRDLWALDCELLVDWGDGVLTQARRFTLRELGEPPESDHEMRNIYSQGFAYLKCFVPHKPPGRADLKIRIPKSLWEYWEAFANDKNNAVTFHVPEVFVTEVPLHFSLEPSQETIVPNVHTNWTNKVRREDTANQRSHPYSPPTAHRASPSPSPKSIGNNVNTNHPASSSG
ncbi:putative apicomplexan-specific protein [Cryptosporidium canis]|nr:putative apicomplexan-specific protein [Cryptosporidium canis]